MTWTRDGKWIILQGTPAGDGSTAWASTMINCGYETEEAATAAADRPGMWRVVRK